MNKKGQGAIEYLLIIGAAILVVAVVIIALSGVFNTAKQESTYNESTFDAFDKQQAELKNLYFIKNQSTMYMQYGGPDTNIQNLQKTSTGVTICLGTTCTGNTIIKNGNTIKVTTTTSSGTITKENLTFLDNTKVEVCNNKIDDDLDGSMDCKDLDCASDSFCSVVPLGTIIQAYICDGEDWLDLTNGNMTPYGSTEADFAKIQDNYYYWVGSFFPENGAELATTNNYPNCGSNDGFYYSTTQIPYNYFYYTTYFCAKTPEGKYYRVGRIDYSNYCMTLSFTRTE